MKKLENSWSRYNNGDVESGYIELDSKEQIIEYVEEILQQEVIGVEKIGDGETYPHNRSNPYFHDRYQIKLNDGVSFKLERQYGQPAWKGKVSHIERISISLDNIKI